METLRGKVFLIILSEAGECDVGRFVATTFAKYSAKLVLCASSSSPSPSASAAASELEQLAVDCSKAGLDSKDILTIPMMDIKSETEMKAAIQKTISHFGCLHGLVLVVNHVISKTFEETSLDDLNDLHLSHVESPLLWVQNAIKHLKATKGSVVLLSPDYSRSSVVGMFPFALVKAAEDHLIRTMALDLASYKIRVNSISPWLPNKETEEIDLESSGKEKTPTTTTSTASEYAAYLSSDIAALITGQCISVGSGPLAALRSSNSP